MGFLTMALDPTTGVRDDFKYDHTDDRFYIRSSQDVAPMMRANRDDRLSGNDGYTPSRDLWKIASIPNIVAEKWMREKGVNILNPEHRDKVLQLLDDPEWAYLRTAEGRVSRRPGRVYFHSVPAGGPVVEA
jgi:hypothetical protein